MAELAATEALPQGVNAQRLPMRACPQHLDFSEHARRMLDWMDFVASQRARTAVIRYILDSLPSLLSAGPGAAAPANVRGVVLHSVLSTCLPAVRHADWAAGWAQVLCDASVQAYADVLAGREPADPAAAAAVAALAGQASAPPSIILAEFAALTAEQSAISLEELIADAAAGTMDRAALPRPLLHEEYAELWARARWAWTQLHGDAVLASRRAVGAQPGVAWRDASQAETAQCMREAQAMARVFAPTVHAEEDDKVATATTPVRALLALVGDLESAAQAGGAGSDRRGLGSRVAHLARVMQTRLSLTPLVGIYFGDVPTIAAVQNRLLSNNWSILQRHTAPEPGKGPGVCFKVPRPGVIDGDASLGEDDSKWLEGWLPVRWLARVAPLDQWGRILELAGVPGDVAAAFRQPDVQAALQDCMNGEVPDRCPVVPMAARLPHDPLAVVALTPGERHAAKAIAGTLHGALQDSLWASHVLSALPPWDGHAVTMFRGSRYGPEVGTALLELRAVTSPEQRQKLALATLRMRAITALGAIQRFTSEPWERPAYTSPAELLDAPHVLSASLPAQLMFLRDAWEALEGAAPGLLPTLQRIAPLLTVQDMEQLVVADEEQHDPLRALRVHPNLVRRAVKCRPWLVELLDQWQHASLAQIDPWLHARVQQSLQALQWACVARGLHDGTVDPEDVPHAALELYQDLEPLFTERESRLLWERPSALHPGIWRLDMPLSECAQGADAGPYGDPHAAAQFLVSALPDDTAQRVLESQRDVDSRCANIAAAVHAKLLPTRAQPSADITAWPSDVLREQGLNILSMTVHALAPQMVQLLHSVAGQLDASHIQAARQARLAQRPAALGGSYVPDADMISDLEEPADSAEDSGAEGERMPGKLALAAAARDARDAPEQPHGLPPTWRLLASAYRARAESSAALPLAGEVGSEEEPSAAAGFVHPADLAEPSADAPAADGGAHPAWTYVQSMWQHAERGAARDTGVIAPVGAGQSAEQQSTNDVDARLQGPWSEVRRSLAGTARAVSRADAGMATTRVPIRLYARGGAWFHRGTAHPDSDSLASTLAAWDAPCEERSVFVTRVPPGVTEAEVAAAFERAGPVASVKLEQQRAAMLKHALRQQLRNTMSTMRFAARRKRLEGRAEEAVAGHDEDLQDLLTMLRGTSERGRALGRMLAETNEKIIAAHPLHAVVTFQDAAGAQAATSDFLKLFGIVLHERACPVLPARAMKTLHLSGLPTDCPPAALQAMIESAIAVRRGGRFRLQCVDDAKLSHRAGCNGEAYLRLPTHRDAAVVLAQLQGLELARASPITLGWATQDEWRSAKPGMPLLF